MISHVENCPEDYAGTKWEMLPAMKGLLDNETKKGGDNGN